jgi:hypothetical protein
MFNKKEVNRETHPEKVELFAVVGDGLLLLVDEVVAAWADEVGWGG